MRLNKMHFMSGPDRSPWSGNSGRKASLPPAPRNPRIAAPRPLSWDRTLVGLCLATGFIFIWPTLLLVSALIPEGLAAVWAALVIGFLGMLYFGWLLVPMMIAQAAALTLFVTVMRVFGRRLYWWQPMVVSTAALSATKMWIYDYRNLDTAVGFSISGGIPAGLIFWLAAAGPVIWATGAAPGNAT